MASLPRNSIMVTIVLFPSRTPASHPRSPPTIVAPRSPIVVLQAAPAAGICSSSPSASTSLWRTSTRLPPPLALLPLGRGPANVSLASLLHLVTAPPRAESARRQRRGASPPIEICVAGKGVAAQAPSTRPPATDHANVGLSAPPVRRTKRASPLFIPVDVVASSLLPGGLATAPSDHLHHLHDHNGPSRWYSSPGHRPNRLLCRRAGV